MSTELPEIAKCGNRLLRRGGDLVGRILLRIDEITHKGIDLRRLEAGDFDIEVALRKENGELAEFRSESGTIPARVGRNLVFG